MAKKENIRFVKTVCVNPVLFEGFVVGKEYTFVVYDYTVELLNGSFETELVYECEYIDYRLECTETVGLTEEGFKQSFKVI